MIEELFVLALFSSPFVKECAREHKHRIPPRLFCVWAKWLVGLLHPVWGSLFSPLLLSGKAELFTASLHSLQVPDFICGHSLFLTSEQFYSCSYFHSSSFTPAHMVTVKRPGYRCPDTISPVQDCWQRKTLLKSTFTLKRI